MWRGKSSYAIRTSVRVVGGSGLKTVEHIEHIEKLSRYRTIEQGLENCRNIAITSSKVPCIWAWFAPEGALAFSGTVPCKRTLASAYPPKPLLFTLWIGAWLNTVLEQIRETVEVSNYRAGTSKLSQYRSLEQRLKTVELIEHIEKLSRYRTIEEGLENCRNIGHSSKA